jgi:hypothetical protein
VSGAGGAGRKARQVAVVAAVLAALVVIGAVGYLLSTPTVNAVHSVTGGRWGADVAVGILLLIVPMAAVIGYAWLARRRGWPQPLGWWLLVLYLPAFELEPFGRSGTNTNLENQINAQLPGLLGGMLAGVLVLLAPVAALALIGVWRKRRTRES